jgi:hypothetical protein
MELDSILYAMRRTTFLTLLLISSSLLAQRKTENVVLITFDGFRWQELFSGADQRLISKSYVNDSAAIAKKYWRDNADGRRLELLPFFWTVIAKQGQIYGNRNEGSLVNVTNRQWFSYPGYSEFSAGSLTMSASLRIIRSITRTRPCLSSLIRKRPSAAELQLFPPGMCSPILSTHPGAEYL